MKPRNFLITAAVAAVILVGILSQISGPIRPALAGIALVHSAVNVGATSTEVLGSSTTRRILLMQNDSDTDIYCKLDGTAATINAGVRLNANGGGFVLDVVAPSGAVYCIHGSTGNKIILVTTE
jgi:hypothetical protein